MKKRDKTCGVVETKERIAKSMLKKIEEAKTKEARAQAVAVYDHFVRACAVAHSVIGI